ncbi:zinc finger MYM-type protein 1-like [Panicum hallii]|uniref:zinc finger MYM-type protein 1-like n=1 Tax=Panicum hallii TaxID=206008 RepID=UPI000DF4D784|nr:zinc finger MYM-type protein 1-like [Panicum hallii]
MLPLDGDASNPSSSRKGKRKAQERDLKSYFSPFVSSSINPSTHGSEVGNAIIEEEEVVETHLEDTNTIDQQPGSNENDQNDQGTITEFNPDYIISDPGLRIPIEQFSPNIRDEIRRAFMERGPTQPSSHVFPRGQDKRRFRKEWFEKYNWLEYSLVNDKAYCFCCYLFRRVGVDDDKFGYEAFTKEGFRQWKNAYLALPKHVGGPNSAHNRSRAAFDDFDNQRASVKEKIVVHTKEAQKKYETRVDTSLAIVSYIALQGEPFRGHDESETSLNKGNFLEFLDWYKLRNEEVRQAFEFACPKNAKMTSGTIQKELAECCAQAVTKVIKEEMSGCLFSILVDESRDISVKEQMAIIVRYVNKKGQVVERFLGIKHVKLTTSEALKRAIVEVLSAHGLTIAKIRGQGYDGASNMRGEFNGVQKLIRDENPYAFYIHCFAHQLQLVVVSVSKCCSSIEDFFDYVDMIVSSTSASCKRKDLLIDSHHTIVLNKLDSGDILSGRGQNQETSLSRPGDTRWGSHYRTLLRIETMWDSIIEVLQVVHDEEQEGSKYC